MAVRLIVRMPGGLVEPRPRVQASSSVTCKSSGRDVTGGNYDCVTLAEAETRRTTFKQIIPESRKIWHDCDITQIILHARIFLCSQIIIAFSVNVFKILLGSTYIYVQ